MFGTDNDKIIDREQSLREVQNHTRKVVRKAMQSDGATLVDAMPAAGKTYSTYEAAAEVDLPVSYLTERTDLYDEAKDEFEERGLMCKKLPSPHRKCPTFMGKHGSEWKKKVRRLYNRGVSGGNIHADLDLPCESDCPYSREWDFSPENYDILIGHYSHAHVTDKVVSGRVVVVDEFAEDGFTHEFTNPQPIVSHYLEQRDGLPFDNWTELIEGRDGEDVQEAVSWFKSNPRDPSSSEVVTDDSRVSHTLAGQLVISLLTITNIGNEFEVAMKGNEVCVHSLVSDTIWLLNPPELDEAHSVVGLDGTPCPPMWNTAFGMDFTVEQVVPTDEKNRYVHEVLDLDLYEPEFSGDGGMKPYHNEDWVTAPTDESKLFGLGMEFEQKPALITTRTALREYDDEDVMKHVGLSTNYGSIHSSNEFKDEDVGMVSGCPRPSDDVIKRWTAMMGYPTERQGQGDDIEFTNPYGEAVFRHYTEEEVLQAVLRFGRDGSGAAVLVNTTATPDWLTTEDVDLPMTSPGERAIITTLKAAKEPLTQNMICTLSGVSVNRVSEILGEFNEDDLVNFGTDDDGTLCYSWSSS